MIQRWFFGVVASLVCGLGAARGAELPAADWVVAVDGDDEHPGTAEKPLRTLAEAQLRIRGEQAAGAQRDFKVLIRRGVYRLDQPLHFRPVDAAPAGCTITYAAAPGEEVVLSGGRPITGWRQVGDHLETTVPEVAEGMWNFRELFIHGAAATRARTPNDGYLRVEQPGPDNRTSFTFAPGDLAAWPSLEQGEIVFLHDWSISRIGLAAIDPSQRTIAFRNPIGAAAPHYAITHFEPHPRYYLENVPELLDAPGEWHLDRRTGVLRYRPREGETAENLAAVAPRLETLLFVEGDEAKRQFVRGLNFSGLTFRHTNYLPPANGYAGSQATMHESRDAPQVRRVMLPAAIRCNVMENCVFENCTFEQLGASGVELGMLCRNNAVVDCTFRDLGGNGLNVGEMFTRGPAAPADGSAGDLNQLVHGNRVEKCLFERCGVFDFGAVGIWVGIAARTRVAHNELRDLPYTGVSVGWRWDPTPTGCRENVIEQNHIHHIMQKLSDGGGIYTLGRQPGTILRNNRIHDVPVNAGRAESNGIFMDEGTTDLLIEENTISAIARSPIRFHRAGVNTLRRNHLTTSPNVAPFRYNNTPEHMVLEENQVELEK